MASTSWSHSASVRPPTSSRRQRPCASGSIRSTAVLRRTSIAAWSSQRAHQADRLDPAAAGVEPRRVGERATGALARLVDRQRLHVVGRQALRRAAGRASTRDREPCSTRSRPSSRPRTPLLRDQRRDGGVRTQRGGAKPARVRRVGGVQHAVQQPGPAGLSRPVRRPAGPRRRCMRTPWAASARAAAAPASPAPTIATSRVAPPKRRPGGCGARCAGAWRAQQHVALGVEARGALHLEARAPPAPRAPRARCSRWRPWHRRPPGGRALQHARLPHRRVLGRREAVEVERIDLRHPLRQPGREVAERQQQVNAAGREVAPMQVGRQRRPGIDQLARQRRLGAVRVRAPHVAGPQRVLVDRQEPQVPATLADRLATRPRWRESCGRGRSRSPGSRSARDRPSAAAARCRRERRGAPVRTRRRAGGRRRRSPLRAAPTRR